MSEDEISGFEDFWTTKQSDYALIALEDGHYTIVKLSTNMDVTIDDDDEYAKVIEKMISMGNRKFTISEYKTLLRSQT